MSHVRRGRSRQDSKGPGVDNAVTQCSAEPLISLCSLRLAGVYRLCYYLDVAFRIATTLVATVLFFVSFALNDCVPKPLMGER